MIVGYHIVFGMYGFWLPNDPRGSWSDFVGSWELFRFGRATKVSHRRSVAYEPHDARLRLAAKGALKYPPVVLTGVQARAVARGFSDYVLRSDSQVWACAILPDHVHLVVGRLHIPVGRWVIQMKGYAHHQLEEEGLHPQSAYRTASGRAPKCFARGHWTAYLEPGDVWGAIEYVENNPVKEGKRRQTWGFVTRPD